jgi:hypothetical protein
MDIENMSYEDILRFRLKVFRNFCIFMVLVTVFVISMAVYYRFQIGKAEVEYEPVPALILSVDKEKKSFFEYYNKVIVYYDGNEYELRDVDDNEYSQYFHVYLENERTILSSDHKEVEVYLSHGSLFSSVSDLMSYTKEAVTYHRLIYASLALIIVTPACFGGYVDKRKKYLNELKEIDDELR